MEDALVLKQEKEMMEVTPEVLILVLMEDALVLEDINDILVLSTEVLILVLMEDALVQYKEVLERVERLSS